jgi:hypothetical protein
MKTPLTKQIWACVCDKCGWDWHTLSDILPKVCAHCKSVRWDRAAKAYFLKDKP